MRTRVSVEIHENKNLLTINHLHKARIFCANKMQNSPIFAYFYQNVKIRLFWRAYLDILEHKNHKSHFKSHQSVCFGVTL